MSWMQRLDRKRKEKKKKTKKLVQRASGNKKHDFFQVTGSLRNRSVQSVKRWEGGNEISPEKNAEPHYAGPGRPHSGVWTSP